MTAARVGCALMLAAGIIVAAVLTAEGIVGIYRAMQP